MAIKNKHNCGQIVPKLSFIYTEKMSSSTDDSDSDPLIEELKNIQMGKFFFIFLFRFLNCKINEIICYFLF